MGLDIIGSVEAQMITPRHISLQAKLVIRI
jgi:hypothetical protein